MVKKKKICPGCGKEFEGRSKYCSYTCAFPAMAESAEQLKAKKGPIYEKWKSRREASKTKI